MAVIIPFPLKNTIAAGEGARPKLPECAGCHQDLPGDYWEVGIPAGDSKEYLALCDSCNADMLKHGVIL